MVCVPLPGALAFKHQVAIDAAACHREEVSVVENFTNVLVATAASCSAARTPSLVAADAPTWGTGMSAGTAALAKALGRSQAPTGLTVQGTGVSTDGPAGGNLQHNRLRDAIKTTEPTNRYFATKQTVVVDDIPGVRTWSPPV
jgi:hypothetical protein